MIASRTKIENENLLRNFSLRSVSYVYLLKPSLRFGHSKSCEDIFLFLYHSSVNFINILHETFSPMYFGTKKIEKPNVIREKLLNLLSYKKGLRSMLMKLTPNRFEIQVYIFLFRANTVRQEVPAVCWFLDKKFYIILVN